MKRIFLIYLSCLVVLLVVTGPWAAGFAQEQPRTSQSQANPPSGSQTQPGNDPQYKQGQNDSNTPSSPNNTPSTTSDRSGTRAETRSAFSWGSAIVGLIIGGIIGYFIGHAPSTRVEGRRDRVA